VQGMSSVIFGEVLMPMNFYYSGDLLLTNPSGPGF
jgi:hypothetical protein